MGMVCVERATGAVREWVRNGQPGCYDPAVHDLIEQADPPTDGVRWDGHAFVPEVIPPPQDVLDRVDATNKIDAVVADNSIPLPVRDALAAIKKVLG